MTRVVKLTHHFGEPFYIAADKVVTITGDEHGAYIRDVNADESTPGWHVRESIDDVARLVWPDLDKPAAPVVSDEDVRIATVMVGDLAIDGRNKEANALARILAALGR